MLSEDNGDVLTELVNIGIGRAAFTLSEMIDARVGLQVPSVCLAHEEGTRRLTARTETGGSLSAVLQEFSGGVAGVAALAIPPPSARRLVAVLTSAASDSAEIDVEREAVLTEVGNIVINCVLGSLGNLAALDVTFHLPRYEENAGPTLETHARRGSLVVVSVLFQVQSHAIEGELAIMFELPSLGGVWALLDPSSASGGHAPSTP
jgi:chemotaxis protein CheC